MRQSEAIPMVLRRWRWIPVAAGAAVVLAACSGREPTGAHVPAPPAAVAAAVAQPRVETVPDEARLPGTVRGTESAVLTARNGGQVTRVLVEAGARVQRGALLVEVDTEEAKAALSQARSQATQALNDLQQAADDERRYKSLLQRGVISKRDYELVKRRYDTAKAASKAAERAVAAAQRRLDYAVVRAPFDGVITERHVDPGDMVTPGAPLLALSGGRAEVRVYAAEELYARIGPDTPVTVDAGGGRYPAAITQRVDAADPVTHTHLIKLLLPAGSDVPSGAYAVASFALGRRQSLTVPASAVITRAGLTGVLVLDERDVAHFREVRTGAAAHGDVVIAAGLSAGERVVARPTPDMGNGTPIRPEAVHG